MPGGNGTGPNGQGPFTGRGLGNCLSYGIPAIAGAAMAWGFGRRRGGGRGFAGGFGGGFRQGMGRGFGLPQAFNWGAPSKNDELTALKEEAKLLQDRINELEKE